ncbi:MAG: PAS domain S-box protein [Bacteroidota bacterium]
MNKFKEDSTHNLIRYKMLMNTSQDAIHIVDKFGNLLEWNEAFKKHLGYTDEELPLLNVMDWDKKWTRPDKLEIMHSISDDGISFEAIHTTKQGIEKSVDIRLNKFYENNELFFYSTARDITDQKKLQKELKKAVIEGEENEKRSISIELHEKIDQVLTGAKIFLSLYEKKGDRKLLNETLVLLDESINKIRDLSHVVALPNLEDTGLESSVLLFLKQIDEPNMINFRLSVNFKEDEYPLDFKTNIYRIIQEAYRNVLAHSKAKHVDIVVEETNNKLKLQIIDDGIGFNPADKIESLGLNKIKTRTDVFNGICIIDSMPGKGCSILIEFPMYNSQS